MVGWMILLIAVVICVAVTLAFEAINKRTEAQKQKDFNESDEEEKISSYIRVKTLLQIIGANIEQERKEEGKTDAVILAAYQGGYFVFYIDDNLDTITIRYNNFYSCTVEQYRELLTATSTTNDRSSRWSCSWWYDNENKENLENMHVDMNSYFSLLGPAQKLAMMLKDHLQQVFRISRFFSDEMDRLTKDKLSPLSNDWINGTYFNEKIRYARTALEKRYIHSDVHELPELEPFSLYNTIMLYGMVELGKVQYLRILCDNRMETIKEETDIVNFDVRDYIISKPDAKRIRNLVFAFAFENKTITFILNKHQSSTEKSLFFETYLVGLEDVHLISNATSYNTKQLSLLEVRFADAEQDFQEAKYMFSEAQEKLNKNEELTDDERLLLSLESPSLYEDFYWAKKFYNNKCFYQSLFYFKRLHNYLKENLPSGEVPVELFCEVTFDFFQKQCKRVICRLLADSAAIAFQMHVQSVACLR